MGDNNLIFIQLAVVLGLAAAIGSLVRLLKLPLVVAYLVAGVILSLSRIFGLSFQELGYLPEIGIAFVLFFIGMELDLGEIKDLGKPIAVTSLAQIIISVIAGYLISITFGLPRVESFYLGIGLSFSSTIVVVKLLLEKKDLTSLYGKLSIGILLLEDLVAILILMGITVGSSMLNLGVQNSLPLIVLLLKGGALLLIALVLSKYVLTGLFNAVAKSAELLFLVSLAWCFIFVAVSLILGFSVVIGAFLAGVALANSPFHYEIQGKVKPLRDFFVTLFFVYLGSQVVFDDIGRVWPLIIIFVVYALVAKPLIFSLILGIFGFKRHTIFKTALNLSQVSEFSLILLMVGVQMKMVSQSSLTVMALTGVISIIISSIMISFSRKIYPKVLPFISFFERKTLLHQLESKKAGESVLEDHVILIGAHRIGGEVLKFLKRESIPFMVLDFNPGIIKRLVGERVHAFYGDVGDPEILEFLNLEKSKLIISTATDLDDSLLLMAEIKRRKVQALIIVRAGSASEAEILYKAGADYVIMPEVVTGDFITQTLKNCWPSLSYFKDRAEVELNKLSKNHLAFE